MQISCCTPKGAYWNGFTPGLLLLGAVGLQLGLVDALHTRLKPSIMNLWINFVSLQRIVIASFPSSRNSYVFVVLDHLVIWDGVVVICQPRLWTMLSIKESSCHTFLHVFFGHAKKCGMSSFRCCPNIPYGKYRSNTFVSVPILSLGSIGAILFAPSLP